MNPRRAKAAYPKVSELVNVPVNDVQTINNFYWKTLRTHLSDLVNPTVTLIGLGEMVVKDWNVPNTIRTLSNKIDKWKSDSTEGPIFTSYTTDLIKVVKMKQMIDLEKEKELLNKVKRKEYGV